MPFDFHLFLWTKKPLGIHYEEEVEWFLHLETKKKRRKDYFILLNYYNLFNFPITQNFLNNNWRINGIKLINRKKTKSSKNICTKLQIFQLKQVACIIRTKKKQHLTFATFSLSNIFVKTQLCIILFVFSNVSVSAFYFPGFFFFFFFCHTKLNTSINSGMLNKQKKISLLFFINRQKHFFEAGLV